MPKQPREPEGEPMTCAVCTSCWSNPHYPGRCYLGGPYIGYSREDGTLEDREGKPLGRNPVAKRTWGPGDQG